VTRIGILGGTFDPIHMGHLDVARASADALHLDQVRLLPSNIPPHRPQPIASPMHRFAMTALAAQSDLRYVADDEELRREGPSYAADTLRHVQQQGWKARQLFFLTGADAFAEIATWKDYPALLDLAHFVVCTRPGRPAAMVRGLLPALQERMVDAGDFTDQDTPRVILLDAQTADISSTAVRAVLAGGDTDVALRGLLPPMVFDHIRRHGLYNSN
jgi:nicotinate-nucleotide adenylyltransferase